MHQGFFLEHIYTEVFIISLNLGRQQLIEIHTEFFDVMESLNPRRIEYNKDVKVVHGYLLPATVLPSNFNNISGFVVINLPDTNFGSFTGEAFCNSTDIAVTIQTAIATYEKVRIEDIFILYGTKINLTLSVSEDELDEEIIERSRAVVKEVKRIKEKLETSR